MELTITEIKDLMSNTIYNEYINMLVCKGLRVVKLDRNFYQVRFNKIKGFATLILGIIMGNGDIV